MPSDGRIAEIARLVDDHLEAVYRYAYALSGSPSDAEDLVQDAFLVALDKLDQVRNLDCARSWLFVIVRNRFLRSRRRLAPTPATNLQMDLNDVADAVQQPDGEIEIEQLRSALAALPEVFRVVLTMFYFENLSYREMAEALGAPIGTVMSRLARAKAHLRAELSASREAEQLRSSASRRG